MKDELGRARNGEDTAAGLKARKARWGWFEWTLLAAVDTLGVQLGWPGG